jgi:hypothetical protein
MSQVYHGKWYDLSIAPEAIAHRHRVHLAGAGHAHIEDVSSSRRHTGVEVGWKPAKLRWSVDPEDE